MTVTFAGVTHPDPLNCTNILIFGNIPAGTYSFTATGCGLVWNGSIDVDGVSNYRLALCPPPGGECCRIGCALDGSFICDECQQGWGSAYDTLLSEPSDLELLREYRDQLLTKTETGALYTELLYESSEEALEVLIDHPELMSRARDLIEANREAVAEVLNGSQGVIDNTDEVVSFLEDYADVSPPALKALANMVKTEILKKQEGGETFLGFGLK